MNSFSKGEAIWCYLFQIPICRYLCWILLGGEYLWNLMRLNYIESVQHHSAISRSKTNRSYIRESTNEGSEMEQIWIDDTSMDSVI